MHVSNLDIFADHIVQMEPSAQEYNFKIDPLAIALYYRAIGNPDEFFGAIYSYSDNNFNSYVDKLEIHEQYQDQAKKIREYFLIKQNMQTMCEPERITEYDRTVNTFLCTAYKCGFPLSKLIKVVYTLPESYERNKIQDDLVGKYNSLMWSNLPRSSDKNPLISSLPGRFKYIESYSSPSRPRKNIFHWFVDESTQHLVNVKLPQSSHSANSLFMKMVELHDGYYDHDAFGLDSKVLVRKLFEHDFYYYSIQPR